MADKTKVQQNGFFPPHFIFLNEQLVYFGLGLLAQDCYVCFISFDCQLLMQDNDLRSCIKDLTLTRTGTSNMIKSCEITKIRMDPFIFVID